MSDRSQPFLPRSLRSGLKACCAQEHALSNAKSRAYRRFCFAFRPLLLVLALVAVVIASREAPGNSLAAPDSSPLQLPPNFKAQVFATNLRTPRFVSFSPEGDLYVANIDSGTVAVLPDRNHDGVADSVIAFASGFASPNNVAFYHGAVYVGETGRIWRL